MSNTIVSKGIFNKKPMSNQQAFDRVWQRFILEKAPIATQAGVCMYRVGEDHGCAIGVQMPDSMYTPALEKHGAYLLLLAVNPTNAITGKPLDKIVIEVLRDHFDRVAPALLMELQKAHDSTDHGDVFGFATKLIQIARDFQLDIPGGAA